MSEGVKTTCPKLNENNFFYWKSQIMLVLRAKSLWRCVQFPNCHAYYQAISSGQKIEIGEIYGVWKDLGDKKQTKIEDIKILEKWLEDDQRCHATICLLLDQKYHEITQSAVTSHELWIAILKTQMNLSSYKKSELLVELFSSKIKEDESLTSFLDRLIHIKSKIKDLGESKLIDAIEFIFCYFVLGCLPEKHQTIRLSCQLVEEAKLNVDLLRTNFALDKTKKKPTSHAESLNTTTGKNKNNNNNSNGNKNNNTNNNYNNSNNKPRCELCGYTNHVTKDCRASDAAKLRWKEKSNNRNSNNNNSNSNNNNNKSAIGNSVVFTFATEISALSIDLQRIEEEASKKIYADSAATRHLINNSREFVGDSRKSDLKVQPAFGEAAMNNITEGELMMSTENRQHKIVLQDVVNVPELKRNLLSVPQICLTHPKAKVIFKYKKMKVIENDVVIMRGEMDETGLYAIIEDPISEPASTFEGVTDDYNPPVVCNVSFPSLSSSESSSTCDTDEVYISSPIKDEICLVNSDAVTSNAVIPNAVKSDTIAVLNANITKPKNSRGEKESEKLSPPPVCNNPLSCDVMSGEAANTANVDIVKLWHERLGHVSLESLKRMANEASIKPLVNALQNVTEFPCEVCCRGKLTRKKFKKNNSKKSENIGDLIHSDVVGPMPVESYGGARYFVTFIDDSTNYPYLYFMKKKSEVTTKFKEFRALMKTQFGVNIKRFRNDQGGEYVSNELKEYLNEKGIIVDPHPANTPQWSGVAERFNRTVVEKARCIMFEAKVEEKLWAEAINTATFLIRRTPTRSLNFITPHEKLFKKKPNINAIRTFGCTVQARDNRKEIKKFDSRAREAILVGFDEQHTAYRIWLINEKRVVLARDVVFFENKKSSVINNNNINNSNNIAEEEEVELSNEEESEEDAYDDDQLDTYLPALVPRLAKASDVSNNTNNSNINDKNNSNNTNNSNNYLSLKDRVEKKLIMEEDNINNSNNLQPPPKCFVKISNAKSPTNTTSNNNNESEVHHTTPIHTILINNVIAEANQVEEPRTFVEAMKSENKKEWMDAIESEKKSLEEMETWELVDPPPGRKIIGSKWVFKVKTDEKGEIERYKARLVVKGFNQVKVLTSTKRSLP
jgi:transposase InsO family protein